MRIGSFLLFIVFIFCYSSIDIKALEEKQLENNEYQYTIEELKDGVNLNEEIFIVNDGFKYQMNDIVIGDDCFLICGEYQSELSYETRFFNTFPYLAFYQDNTLKWKIKTDFYGHGKFISGLILEDKIIVTGTFETKLQRKQIGIFEISFNGDILNYYITNGNNNSESEGIYVIGTHYYVTGITDATDLGYGKVENINHILVMQFDSKLKNCDNLYLSNDRSGKLFQTVFCDDKIFLYGQINGEGYFENNRSNNLIFVVSERLDLDMYKQVNHDQKAQLFAIDEKILLFEYQRDPSKIKVTIYGYGLNEQKEQYLDLAYNVYNIESFNVHYSSSDNKILIGSTLSNNNDHYDFFTLLDKELEILHNIEIKKKDKSILTNCSLINGELYSFGIYDNNIYGRKVMTITLKDGECFFNGIKGEKIIKQINENTFGIYDQEINYLYNDILIKTFDKYKILPKCSVQDKGVYQKGFVLEFNGVGYLNSVEIASGYIIDQNNSYLLEVKGKDESVYYTFIVKELSVEEKTFQYDSIEIEEVENKIIYQQKEERFNVEEENNKVNGEYIVIIFVIIGLVIGLFIPLKKRGNKNV